jgi:hypothetical protein
MIAVSLQKLTKGECIARAKFLGSNPSLACCLLSLSINESAYGFPRDVVVSRYLAVGLMVFDLRKHFRSLLLWNAVGNVFRPWPALSLNDKRLLDFLCKDDLKFKIEPSIRRNKERQRW